jgi:hypothetical protein
VDDQTLREHFQVIGHRICPPMDSAELERYVKATHDKPEILSGLTRVLGLARPGKIQTTV